MSRLTPIFFIAITSCVFAQLKVINEEANGRTDFDYYSEEARTAAAEFINYLDKYNCAVKQLVEELKSKYSAQTQLVDQCASSIPADTSAELNKTITEHLVKVQTYDNDLRFNDFVCFSLRVPPNERCVKAKEEALESIAKVSSKEELEKVDKVKEEASASVKSYLEACIDVNRNH